MSDTFVALGEITAGTKVILGKNSSREPNEAQALLRIPAARHTDAWVKCTYLYIPQVSRTFEVMLAKPFQMWGAEMGINEHGVSIGNVAVFTKTKFEKDNFGLTGMDLVRLTLERCGSAIQAVFLIAELIEDYGQNASVGYQNKKLYYCNSFLIADRRDAYLIETADRQWVIKKIADFYAISNGLTIERDYDFNSENLIKNAIEKGWHKEGTVFNFRKAYADQSATQKNHAATRRTWSKQSMQKNKWFIDSIVAMNMLRSHGKQSDNFQPADSNLKMLCIHANGWNTKMQTVNSMIVELYEDKTDVAWFTGTAAPCISVFKPFFMGDTTLLEENTILPSANYDNSLWWKAEQLHRKILKNYPKFTALFEKEVQDLQANFLAKESILRSNKASKAILQAFSKECLERYETCLETWTDKLEQTKISTHPFAPFYRWYRYRIEQQLKRLITNTK